MYVARDKDGDLYLYLFKPYKVRDEGFWTEDDGYIKLPEDYFPEVKWEDEEPRELILRPIEEK